MIAEERKEDPFSGPEWKAFWDQGFEKARNEAEGLSAISRQGLQIVVARRLRKEWREKKAQEAR